MTVKSGRDRYRNQGRSEPSTAQLARDKDYDALATRGAVARGALKLMARRGDKEAAARLTKAEADAVEQEDT